MPVRLGHAALLLALVATACASRPVKTAPAPGLLPVLWTDPAGNAPPRRPPPRPPFRFTEEDTAGASPKFGVIDANGAAWHVKLGPEAHTEVAAGHLLASVGYFVEDMHYLPTARVEGLRIKRGREFLTGENTLRAARFEARPENVERGDTWDWAANPFVGTEPFDGLRVLMVLINNYDARTANNRILIVDRGGVREARYVVADIGASFGRYGGMGGPRSRNDPDGYSASRFIDRVEQGQVYFAYRTQPEGWATPMFVLNPFYTAGELKKQRDLRSVPVTSARWIAKRLAALGEGAITTAFERAGYNAEQTSQLSRVVRERIVQLGRL